MALLQGFHRSIKVTLALIWFCFYLSIKAHATNTAEMRRKALIEEGKLAALSSHNEKSMADQLEVRIREYMKITEPPILEVTYFIFSTVEKESNKAQF